MQRRRTLRRCVALFPPSGTQQQRSLRRCVDTLRSCVNTLRSGEYFEPYKYPHDLSFSLHTPFCCPFLFLSCFCCYFCISAPLDQPPWLPGSPLQPNNSDPAPPHGWRHPFQKIHIGSFSERPSISITSRYSTARSSRSVVSLPPTCSSTSLSRTSAGRHFVHPLFLEWPRSCGSSTLFCLSRSAPPSSSGAGGSSLVPKPSTRSTA